MKKRSGLHKKLFALFAVMLIILSTATTAFADESTVGLTEVSEPEEQFISPVDYSELEIQMSVVNGLYENDYTKETWKVLKEAYDTGTEILNGDYNQQAVTKATQEIKSALSGLVRVDYSALEKALAGVYSAMDKNPEYHDIWNRINSAVEEARPMLVNGDQEAIDTAAARINSLLKELEEMGDKLPGETEIIIKEVEVEVPPSDDYCNISSHRIWPVFFAISFVLNIAIIGMTGYVFFKKRRTADDIPLVNYDIDDDMDFDDEMDEADIGEETDDITGEFEAEETFEEESED